MSTSLTDPRLLDFEALTPSAAAGVESVQNTEEAPKENCSNDLSTVDGSFLHLQIVRDVSQTGGPEAEAATATNVSSGGVYGRFLQWIFLGIMMPAAFGADANEELDIVHQQRVHYPDGRQTYRIVWSAVVSALCKRETKIRPSRVTVVDPAFAEWLRKEGLSVRAQLQTKVDLVARNAAIVRQEEADGCAGEISKVSLSAWVGNTLSRILARSRDISGTLIFAEENAVAVPDRPTLKLQDDQHHHSHSGRGLTQSSGGEDDENLPQKKNAAGSSSEGFVGVSAQTRAAGEGVAGVSETDAPPTIFATSLFRKDSRVVIRGLQSAEGKLLNGLLGAILEDTPNSAGRWRVNILSTVNMQAAVALKPENLWKPQFSLGEHVDVRLRRREDCQVTTDTGRSCAVDINKSGEELGREEKLASAIVMGYSVVISSACGAGQEEYLVEILPSGDGVATGSSEQPEIAGTTTAAAAVVSPGTTGTQHHQQSRPRPEVDHVGRDTTRILGKPLILKRVKEMDLLQSATSGKVLPFREKELLWNYDENGVCQGVRVEYRVYMPFNPAMWLLVVKNVRGSRDGALYCDHITPEGLVFPGETIDQAMLRLYAQNHIPIRGRDDEQSIADLVSGRHDNSYLHPPPCDAEFDDLVENFLNKPLPRPGDVDDHEETQSTTESPEQSQAAAKNSFYRKSRVMNRLRYLLQSRDELDMTQTRLRRLELALTKEEDGMIDYPGASRSAKRTMCPWRSQAVELARIIDGRADISAADKDHFFDICVQECHKDGTYLDTVVRAREEQDKHYTNAAHLAVGIGAVVVDRESTPLARRGSLAREALRLRPDVSDAVFGLALELRARGQCALALEFVAQAIHDHHAQNAKYRDAMQELFGVALSATTTLEGTRPAGMDLAIYSAMCDPAKIQRFPHLRVRFDVMGNRPYLRQLQMKAVLLADLGRARQALLVGKVMLAMDPEDHCNMRGLCCNWCIITRDFDYLQHALENNPVPEVQETRADVRFACLWLGIQDNNVGATPALRARFLKALEDHPVCPSFILARASCTGEAPPGLGPEDSAAREELSYHRANSDALLEAFSRSDLASVVMNRGMAPMRKGGVLVHDEARRYASNFARSVWRDGAPLPGGRNGCDWLREQMTAHSRRPTEAELRRLLGRRRILLRLKSPHEDQSANSTTMSPPPPFPADAAGSRSPLRHVHATNRMRMVAYPSRPERQVYVDRLRETSAVGPTGEVDTRMLFVVHDELQGEWTSFTYDDVVDAPLINLLLQCPAPRDFASPSEDQALARINAEAAQREQERARTRAQNEDAAQERARFEEEVRTQYLVRYRDAKAVAKHVSELARKLEVQILRSEEARSPHLLEDFGDGDSTGDDGSARGRVATQQNKTRGNYDEEDAYACCALALKEPDMTNKLVEALAALKKKLDRDVRRFVSDEMEENQDVLAAITLHDNESLLAAFRRLLESAENSRSLLDNLIARASNMDFDLEQKIPGRLDQIKTNDQKELHGEVTAPLSARQSTGARTLSGARTPSTASSSPTGNNDRHEEVVDTQDEIIAGGFAAPGVQSTTSGNFVCALTDDKDTFMSSNPNRITLTNESNRDALRFLWKCEQCGEQIPKGNTNARRNHTKKCPKRLIFCDRDHCRMHVTADRFEYHQEAECESRDVECSQCGYDKVPAWRLEDHMRTDCPCRLVQCDLHASGCAWAGPLEERPRHYLTCPYAPTECPQCLEVFPQHQRAAHRCKRVDPRGECLICFESWSTLVSKRGSPPAIFLRDGRRTCVCKSHNICLGCADKVTHTSENGNAACPFCRRECDSATPLPISLLLGVPDTTTARAAKAGKNKRSPENSSPPTRARHEDKAFRFTDVLCRPPADAAFGRTFWVSPLDLRFTHDSVKSEFRDYYDPDVKKHRSQQSILGSIREVLRMQSAGLVPLRLECLDVCWESASVPRGSTTRTPGEEQGQNDHTRLLFLAGTGNRRLTMWRLLALFRPHQFSLIKVRIVDRADPRIKFDEKCTTKDEGRSIYVRGCGNVGLAKDEITWKEALDLLRD
ncbi:unnamed protein product [Amoebophrya sp. A120]|nr:unnamed protein product [Amoebophrya sp. A120]|eukprot:GSA120T00024639001.1